MVRGAFSLSCVAVVLAEMERFLLPLLLGEEEEEEEGSIPLLLLLPVVAMDALDDSAEDDVP